MSHDDLRKVREGLRQQLADKIKSLRSALRWKDANRPRLARQIARPSVPGRRLSTGRSCHSLDLQLIPSRACHPQRPTRHEADLIGRRTGLQGCASACGSIAADPIVSRASGPSEVRFVSVDHRRHGHSKALLQTVVPEGMRSDVVRRWVRRDYCGNSFGPAHSGPFSTAAVTLAAAPRR